MRNMLRQLTTGWIVISCNQAKPRRNDYNDISLIWNTNYVVAWLSVMRNQQEHSIHFLSGGGATSAQLPE